MTPASTPAGGAARTPAGPVGRQVAAGRWAADVLRRLGAVDRDADVSFDVSGAFDRQAPARVEFHVREGRDGDPRYGDQRKFATLASLAALLRVTLSAHDFVHRDKASTRVEWFGHRGRGGCYQVRVWAHFSDPGSIALAHQRYGAAGGGAVNGAGGAQAHPAQTGGDDG